MAFITSKCVSRGNSLRERPKHHHCAVPETAGKRYIESSVAGGARTESQHCAADCVVLLCTSPSTVSCKIQQKNYLLFIFFFGKRARTTYYMVAGEEGRAATPWHQGGQTRGNQFTDGGKSRRKSTSHYNAVLLFIEAPRGDWQQGWRETIPCSNTDNTEVKYPKGRPPERT